VPSLDQWQRLGIVCGSILAALALAGWAARGIRRMWRLMSKANRWLDQVLGEPARDGEPARPGLMERVAGIERRMAAIDVKLAEHLEWHGDPDGSPTRRVSPKPNGGVSRTARSRPRPEGG
jgi:hypothetical protein